MLLPSPTNMLTPPSPSPTEPFVVIQHEMVCPDLAISSKSADVEPRNKSKSPVLEATVDQTPVATSRAGSSESFVDVVDLEATMAKTTTAPTPFNKPNADIILRTSDLVEFYVFSQILIAASPYFESVFEDPQPLQPIKSGRPIIDVTEEGATIETLLRICYPINKPMEARTLVDIEPALRAALKYKMELPTTVLTGDLEVFAQQRPMHVWAIACRLQLEHLARHAAHALSLAHPLNFTLLDDMVGITAGHYFRLNDYHESKGKVVRDFCFLSPVRGKLLKTIPTASSPISLPLLPLTKPSADLDCRSKDGSTFRAHKMALSLASPVLRDKIAVLEEDPSTASAPVVLPFEEHSDILRPLLALAYVVDSDHNVELPSCASQFMALILAAEEYRMVSAQSMLRSKWDAIASSDTLKAYCAAVQARHAECATEAAQLSLTQVIDGRYVPELELIPALPYRRLLLYHKECRQLAIRKFTRIRETLQSLSRPIARAAAAPCTVEPERQKDVEPSLPVGSTFTYVTVEGGARKPKPKKGRAAKKAAENPKEQRLDDSWLSRHVGAILSNLQLQPGLHTSSLGRLFTDATEEGEVWCAQCQVTARDIMQVRDELRQYSRDLEDVVRKIF